MLFDPLVIADVGFELSYLAVIGIYYLYPKISEIFIFKIPKRPKKFFPKPIAFFRWAGLWLCDWVWQLVAVSLAAELATVPLSLLYFYQFPNLFLISNLVVIPMSDLVLFSGTALCAVGHIPYLNTAAGSIFNALITVLDKFIFWVGHLPYALTHALCIGPAEVVLMYLLIFLICLFTVDRKAKILIASLCIVLLLCSFNSYRAVRNSTRRELVVYSVPKEKAIALITGKSLLYDFSDSLWNNADDMAFHIRHHWAECGIIAETPILNSNACKELYFGKYVMFEGKGILIIDSSLKEIMPVVKVKLKTDIIILSGSPSVHMDYLKSLFDLKQLVFDSSNKPGSIRRWKKECEAQLIPYYDVVEKGAFIRDFPNQ